jgi:hypothetical protein
MNFLRQSTAVDIGIGPFVDSTDGVTAETGLTISQADVRLKKNNGAWAQVNDNTSATHEENGWYEKELDATDTNTVGILIVAVNESGALPVWREFQVLEEAVYDALFASAAAGYGTAQTGDSFARLGAPAGASVSADIAAVKVDTAAILVDTGTTLDGKLDTIDNFLDTEVSAIITTLGTPAGASVSADIAALAANIVRSGTAQGGSINSITLDAGASATNGTYDPALIRLTGGTGSGQARMCINYVGATKVASVDRDWRTAPDNTTTFQIIAAPNLHSTNEGLAQGGTSQTITLNADASSADGTYVGQTVFIRTGTGQDQARVIAIYTGATRVATLAQAWVTTPDTTSGYMLLPIGRAFMIYAETGSINSATFAAGAITAAAIASNAIDADALSADAIAEINATVDTAIADAALATAANLATVDTVVDAIKAKTDSLTFTVANQLDSNVQSINDVTITGDGQVGTEFGV